MAHEIEFSVDKEGNVEFDIQGFHGKGCAEIASQFAKALGKKMKDKTKHEFYEPEVVQKQKIIRGM
jgi:hypothetical protein